jgi:hypothetical protein
MWLMQLAHDYVLRRAFVLAELNLHVLLRESWLITKMDLRETGYDGSW